MAVAISAPGIKEVGRSEAHAATWTGISAGVALAATIPLVIMLAGPISNLLFVRGSQYNGDWTKAFELVLILVAPATYALFFGTAGELLKSRIPQHVHKTTMRVAAVGFVPYLVMVSIGAFWTGGPQESFLLAAGLTVPIAMVATIWASTQNH